MTELVLIMTMNRIIDNLQVFSQNDEDGAIEEVFRKIGTTDKVKLDFFLKGFIRQFFSSFAQILDSNGVWVLNILVEVV